MIKKILLTVGNFELYGTEQYVLLLSKYINKDKYDITVAIPGFGPYCEILDKEKIKYIIFNDKSNKTHSFKGIINLYRYLRKNKFDIIHAHAGIAPCVLGKLLNIKMVIEHRHGIHYTEEQIKRMKFVKVLYERAKKFFVNYTITDCRNDKEILINKFNYKKHKIVIINNCIEKYKLKYEKKSDKCIIGTMGRLTYQKGQEYFIEMANVLLKEGYNYSFYIYGLGENFNMYNELIKKYKIGGSVFLKGYGNDVYKALGEMDIFVLTSRFEGIPYVIFNAMNMALPIVCTDVGGVREVINHMENGIIVQKGNVNELVTQIKNLVANKNLMKTLGQNAKKDLEKNYLIDKTIKSIEELYSRSL